VIVAETNNCPVESGGSFGHGKSDRIFAQRARGGLKNKHKGNGLAAERMATLSERKMLYSRSFGGARRLPI
jgi:hypothetical protein